MEVIIICGGMKSVRWKSVIVWCVEVVCLTCFNLGDVCHNWGCWYSWILVFWLFSGIGEVRWCVNGLSAVDWCVGIQCIYCICNKLILQWVHINPWFYARLSAGEFVGRYLFSLLLSSGHLGGRIEQPGTLRLSVVGGIRVRDGAPYPLYWVIILVEIMDMWACWSLME